MKLLSDKIRALLLATTLLILLTLAFAIRFESVLQNNILFLYDNARDMLFVKQIVFDHRLLLIGPSSGGLQGYFHGVFWYYALSIPFFLGNGNPAALTLFMILGSVFSIILTYFVLRKTTDFSTSLLGVTIFCFATFSVQTARFIWNPFPIVWLMPLYFLLLFAFTKGKHYVLPALALVTGLIIHLEIIYGICLLPTLVVAFLLELLRKNKKSMTTLLLSFFLLLLPFLPTLLFDVRHHFLIASSLSKTFSSGGVNLTHNATAVPFEKRLTDRASNLYEYTIDSISPNKQLNLFLFFMALGGFSYAFYRKEKIKTITGLSMLTLVAPFFIFLNLKYAVWSYYWIGSSPMYVFFLCLGVKQVTKTVPQTKIIVLLLTISLLFIYDPVTDLRSHWNAYAPPGPTRLATELQITRDIQTNAGNKEYAVFLHTPPVYDYTYRYLLWWNAKNTSKNFPHDEKQKNTYVIFEPSPTDPKGIFFKEKVLQIYEKPKAIWLYPGKLRVEVFEGIDTKKKADPNIIPQL